MQFNRLTARKSLLVQRAGRLFDDKQDQVFMVSPADDQIVILAFYPKCIRPNIRRF